MPKKVCKWRDWTDAEFAEVVRTSNNWTHFLQRCGYKNTGNNKPTMRRIKELDLDFSHFYNWIPKNRNYSNEELFIENSSYVNRQRIKERLIKDFGWVLKCNGCGITEWRGKKITLELEHKNGINNDHRLENLEFLCPNCHSQTPTFRVKNIKSKKK
jgi:Zn finger protein HypA/HybF involved in hydrogenase expression